jgi:hypothetical protein
MFVLAAQVVAQNPIPIAADRPDAVTDTPQIAAAAYTPALQQISAPTPARQEANLKSLQGTLYLALPGAQNSGQNSSQETPAAATPAQPKTAKANTPHHGLGLALVIVGTTALAAGIALYEGEQHAYCNGSSTGCSEARDTGIALMPIGAGVAVTGIALLSRH